MNDIWFSTLSSIIQAMAALLALFSVFVLFKIERIKKDLEDFRENAIRIFISIKNNENTPCVDEKNNKIFCSKYNLAQDVGCYYDWSDEKIRIVFKDFFDKKSNFMADMQFGNRIIGEENFKIFCNLLNEKEKIISKLSWSVIFSSFTIIIPILLISIPLDLGSCYVNFLFYFIVFSFVFSILYIAKSILDIIKK